MRELTEAIQEVEQIAQTINAFKDRCKKLANTPATADELYQLSSAAGKFSVSLPETFGYIAQELNYAADDIIAEEELTADDEEPVKLSRAGLKAERFG